MTVIFRIFIYINPSKNYPNWYYIPIQFHLSGDYIVLCQRGETANIKIIKEFCYDTFCFLL